MVCVNLSADMISLLLALLSGVLMAVQGAMNGALGKAIGTWETTFIVHLLGLVVLSILLFGFSLGRLSWEEMQTAPWYVYLGGIVGVFIIYLVAVSIPKIGAANATTAIIIGQVGMAVLIDHLGLFGLSSEPFGWKQGVGIAFLAIGAKLLLRGM
jgi:transporter family-2 protein